jgi:stage II sporulation protein AA (anti-sigma F factor antagonist)
MYPSPDHVHIVLSGEIDMANARNIQDVIFDAVGNRLNHVTIDLSGLGYIDSAGMRLLFTLAARLKTLQIGLELIATPDSPARQVLAISGVESITSVKPPLRLGTSERSAD